MEVAGLVVWMEAELLLGRGWAVLLSEGWVKGKCRNSQGVLCASVYNDWHKTKFHWIFVLKGKVWLQFNPETSLIIVAQYLSNNQKNRSGWNGKKYLTNITCFILFRKAVISHLDKVCLEELVGGQGTCNTIRITDFWSQAGWRRVATVLNLNLNVIWLSHPAYQFAS